MRKGTKRKTTHMAEPESRPVEDRKIENEETKPEESSGNSEPGRGRRKRIKAAKPETEPEFFPENRNLEDLWRQVFPVGTEWHNLDSVYGFKWNFSNLEEALEGGELHKSLWFYRTWYHLFLQAPSDKVGIKSLQREVEEIVPMKQMKMDWVPYIPLENRKSQVERLNSQIFFLSCTQRRAGLRHLKIERVKEFEYCLPYFYDPRQEDEFEQSTEVNISYPIDPNSEFTDKLVEEEVLVADQREQFKDFVNQRVREAKKANREARQARRKAREEMGQEARAAFENMKFYKFYPVPSPETPDVSSVKEPYINRYYGKAHKVI